MVNFFQIFNFLSLTINPLEGKLQQLTKEETICKLLTTDSDREKDNLFSSYTEFGDLEIFLHGLGLEHITDLLKVRFCVSYNKLCLLFVG